jgi:protein tyrosine phosphatase (PTP) superfamily phosphohydrolase (DUF442 family)
MSKRRVALAVLAVPLLAISALANGGSKNITIAKPPVSDSMKPIKVAGLAIKNFGVVDGRIYRGEQPARDEYDALAALGVKVIVDLRLDAKKFAKASAEAAGLRYVNIPIDDHGAPTDADAAEFLRLLEETGDQPVYVHCAGGRHRTGAMVAVYRMACNGWNVEQAYQEMLGYDFYTAWGHEGFKTYVFDFYRRKTADPSSVPVWTSSASAASH